MAVASGDISTRSCYYESVTHSLTLVVTFFSLLVMLVIMTNCVFMAINKEIPYTE